MAQNVIMVPNVSLTLKTEMSAKHDFPAKMMQDLMALKTEMFAKQDFPAKNDAELDGAQN